MLIFAGFFIWGWKSGQFKDIEEAKYIIFRRPKGADESDQTPTGKGEDK